MDNLNKNLKEKIEISNNILSSINLSIQNADTKASILIAFIALLIGLTTEVFSAFIIIRNFENAAQSVFLIIFLIVYFVSLLGGLACESLVLFARTKEAKYKKEQGIQSSIVFFEDIKKLGYVGYSDKLNLTNEEDMLAQINGQVVINSRIASHKFKFFNLALISSIIMTVCTVGLLILVNIR